MKTQIESREPSAERRSFGLRRSPTSNCQLPTANHSAFTLVEMLVAVAVLSMLMFLLFTAVNQASRAWLQGENRVETFTAARAALDFMSKELAQAMVNNELVFTGTTSAVSFQAPVNTATNAIDLVAVGYSLNVGSPPYNLTRSPSGILAENIVSLDFQFLNTNNTFVASWNSTSAGNRAPLGVQITIGAIDSRAAARIAANPGAIAAITNQSAQTFTTFVAIPSH